MPTYVLMTKLSGAELKDRRRAGKGWKKKVEKLVPGIKWIAHYALLGPYDFMDVYEVKKEEDAFKVSLLSREHGAVNAESWPAMAYDAFLSVADKVEKKDK
jgi:uncharacterized protein with GYD domain